MFDASTEIRTPVLALKGLRPGPLDDGGARNILPDVINPVKKLVLSILLRIF